jgi:hypothetical protein
MTNAGKTEKGKGANWRMRFIVVVTLVNSYIWFWVIPQFIGIELREPWTYAFYYFGTPAIWLFFCWRFLNNE